MSHIFQRFRYDEYWKWTSALYSLVGILLWFPIPFMRNIPIGLAKKLGETTAEYRWFAIVYIVASFFVIPAIIFAISLAGWYVFIGIFGPILLIISLVIIINVLQAHQPKFLPNWLKTWSWLPRPFRTLAWYDENLFSNHKRLLCCNRHQSNDSSITIKENIEKKSGCINETFDDFDRLSGVSTRF